MSDGFPAIYVPWGYTKEEYEYDIIGAKSGYRQYLGDCLIYDMQNVENEVSEVRTIFIRVDFPGLFNSSGFSGTFALLRWNDWSLGDDLGRMAAEINKSNGFAKSLAFCAVQYVNDGYEFGEIIEQIFGNESLGVRVFDYSISKSNYDALMYKYEKYLSNKKV